MKVQLKKDIKKAAENQNVYVWRYFKMSAKKSNGMNQSQKLMVFVLTMSLYGLATLITELIPKFQVGIVEFSV